MIGNYTALDLETTGLNPKYDKIIEVGAVKVRNGEIIDSFQQLVCPGIALPEKITGLTGITQEELLEAKGSETVIPQLLDFLEDDVILGHSVMFDYSFLKKAAVNQNLWRPEQSHSGLDTLRLSRIYLPELPSRRLTDLCLHYGIRHQAHRALGDAESTVQLYSVLCKEFCENALGEAASKQTREEREKTFAPFPLIYKIKRESPIRPQQKQKLYSLLEQHKIIPDYDVEKLTRNEASRLIDRIYFIYGHST